MVHAAGSFSSPDGPGPGCVHPTTSAQYGVAALCEKPIDLDLDRVRGSWEEIKDSSAPLMLAFNPRFAKSFAAVQARTAAGDPRPLLIIAGTEADTRTFSENGVAQAGDNAELFDIPGATHFDLYHRDQYVSQVVIKLVDFYETPLTP